ncbi:hypothetical protein EUX98_g8318 [Antrodiella citrinella]|uniref:Uncharacterized protein n=1 Tax=Antrodiella citrinella TaxID=2447956 RepID=A0A4S4M8E2_9APHY|nr:hypothetical protein EUX98_g8318 [Antrodiella citrinella]
MVTKVTVKRAENSKGMQGFQYPPAYDEFMEIVNIHSPRAYRYLTQQIPSRSQRSFRQKEARKPKFPMTTCHRTFDRVTEYLTALKYNGPVGLSCDDTKLFATFRLYWDADENCHFAFKAILEEARATKATKVRLWCLQVPLPKVPPIIVAARPISDINNADTLLSYLTPILHGLLDRKIAVSSYACDGTTVERNVQHLLVKTAERVIDYTIDNLNPGIPPVHIKIPVIRGYPIAMIQDSKHCLKTLRNNLFSGARLLNFVNFIMFYSHIRQLAMDDGSPLYHRDVDKVDRQDDNVACRLFSAETLSFLCSEHPDWVGAIAYLFVFGDLIDSLQNRHLDHSERLVLVLRARYFIDSWEAFLDCAGYRKDQYFLSREAVDILKILIEGYISLVIIYRDHIKDGNIYPLLPWLHSSEPCEHVFGESRQIVADFTMLDYHHMVNKLTVKLREAVLCSRLSDSRATAAGYNHTYFDMCDMDLTALSSFPLQCDIPSIAERAAAEADSLLLLLGIAPKQLRVVRRNPQTIFRPTLPSIDVWYHPTDFVEDTVDLYSDAVALLCETQRENDADDLQAAMDEAESYSELRLAQDDTLTRVACAAMALQADDIMTIQSLPDFDEADLARTFAEDSDNIMETLQLLKLPPLRLNLPDEAPKQFAFNSPHEGSLDFSGLVALRREHQTRHAESSARTRSSDDSANGKLTARRELIHKLHAVLKEHQDTAATTGAGRGLRWIKSAAGGQESGTTLTTGNSGNAVLAATDSATSASKRRVTLFTKAQVPHQLDICNARVTKVRPVTVGDFGIVWTTSGLMLGHILTMYSKSGFLNGKHQAVTQSTNVSALSYISVQTFQCTARYTKLFSSIPDSTSLLQTKHFAHIPSHMFLTLLSSKPTPTDTSLQETAARRTYKMTEVDFDLYLSLSSNIESFDRATTLFRGRKRVVDTEHDY